MHLFPLSGIWEEQSFFVVLCPECNSLFHLVVWCSSALLFASAYRRIVSKTRQQWVCVRP